MRATDQQLVQLYLRCAVLVKSLLMVNFMASDIKFKIQHKESIITFKIKCLEFHYTFATSSSKQFSIETPFLSVWYTFRY